MLCETVCVVCFQVKDSKIVDYITDFLMLGHTGQKLFILNLLKGVPLEPFYDSLIHLYALKPGAI